MLKPTRKIELDHCGDCYILGMSTASEIYVEEFYENAWTAYHIFRADGERIRTSDEKSGTASVTPLYPDRPRHNPVFGTLNFGGARLRGLRSENRIDELVRPIPIPEKMALIEQLGLDILPPMLLGMSESQVISSTLLDSNTALVCRRVRYAYVLPVAQGTGENAYNYDSITLHIAHWFDSTNDPDPLSIDGAMTGLTRPLSCLAHQDRVYITDGGAGTRQSILQIYDLTGPML